jgi:hypothetical protein
VATATPTATAALAEALSATAQAIPVTDVDAFPARGAVETNDRTVARIADTRTDGEEIAYDGSAPPSVRV